MKVTIPEGLTPKTVIFCVLITDFSCQDTIQDALSC